MEIKISKAIVTFVTSFFPLFSDPKLGLMFTIDMSVDDFGFDETGNNKVRKEFTAHRDVQFIIKRPANNAWVYGRMMTSAKETTKRPHQAEFNLISTHNSCWRDAIDSYICKAYGMMREEYLESGGENCHKNLYNNALFNIFNEPTFVLLGEEKCLGDREKNNLCPWDISVEKILTTKQAAELMNAKQEHYTAFH